MITLSIGRCLGENVQDRKCLRGQPSSQQKAHAGQQHRQKAFGDTVPHRLCITDTTVCDPCRGFLDNSNNHLKAKTRDQIPYTTRIGGTMTLGSCVKISGNRIGDSDAVVSCKNTGRLL
jgi:hypothetical protein